MRGLITVERSPFMKALRVRSATRTILLTMSRPSVGAVVLRLGQHDLDLVVVRQIVERGDDRPAVHLALVDLLRAVIEARRVAEADRVGGGEQPERRMRPDHAASGRAASACRTTPARAGSRTSRPGGRRRIRRSRARCCSGAPTAGCRRGTRSPACRPGARWRPCRSRSMRLMWLSRLTRTHGQLSRAATCSIWVDLPVP